MSALAQSLHEVTERIRAVAGDRPIQLVAVSKTQPVAAIAELAAAGQLHFGENYVQEALGKMDAIALPSLQWHLIGHLQSNKAREAANHFAWVQTLDRARIAIALDRHREPERPPLEVLVQVNIDDEASKSGCAAADLPALLDTVAGLPRLRLRGLMSIPQPREALEAMRPAFARMYSLFEQMRLRHPAMDTLSMGMSADYELAIAEGANLVRVGTALFGSRARSVHGD